jgi:hypothetical protein
LNLAAKLYIPSLSSGMQIAEWIVAAVYCLRFQVLLDVQTNLPETIPISSAQIPVLSSFF